MFTNLLNLCGIICIIAVVTFFLSWLTKLDRFNNLSWWIKQTIFGIVYGLLAVLCTHGGISIESSTSGVSAIINVRDIAPLTAGLAFGPFAGVLAGFIGGAERLFLSGYTTIACGISTILAGISGALLHIILRNNPVFAKNKTCKWYWGLIIGVIIEVVHMGLIAITHTDSISYAWKIISIISPYMIIGTALGLTICLFIFKLTADAERLQIDYTGDADINDFKLKKEEPKQ